MTTSTASADLAGARTLCGLQDLPRSPVSAPGAREAHFTVLEGVVYLILGESESVLTPGDSATISAGAEHRLWNAGEGKALIACS
jgi:mannose-6-phosphate isomerase-like protein (cupin superfamily)